MTVMVRRHDAAPIVSARVYVRAGSALEGRYAGSGISHLLEHVATGDAAGRRSERQILDLCDAIGGLVNAYTSDDHICYHTTAPREHLATAIELLADWAIRPALSHRVFQRELGVVRRELERDRDDPETQLEEMLNAVLYQGHPLQHPIIGQPTALSALTWDDLKAYHRRTHHPENTVVVIVGDLEISEAFAAVRRAFAGFERRPAIPITPPELRPITTPRRAIRIMEVGSSSMTMAWRTVTEGTDDDLALDLLSSVLTEGDTARLVKAIRWDQGLAYDLGGSHESMWHTDGSFEISAQCERERFEAVEQAILDGIERLHADPVTEAELDRARRQATIPLEQQRQTAEGWAAQIGEDYLATRGLNYTDTYIERIGRMTVDDLMRAARQYLRPTCRAVAAILTRTAANDAPPLADRSPPIEVGRCSPSGGLTCLTRAMHTSEFVAISAMFRGGLAAETPETNGAFNLLAETLRRGTRRRSADAIAEFFESRGGTLRIGAGSDAVFLDTVMPATEFEETLDILAEIIAHPALDPAEIDKVRPAICDAIARIDDDWHGELMRFARGAFFRHSPYRRTGLGTVESVLAFKVDDLRALHDRYLRHGHGVVAVAGAIDPSRVMTLCRQHLEDVATGANSLDVAVQPEPTARADRLFVKPTGPDREAAGLFVGYPGPVIDDRPSRAAMAVLGAMAAGYSLSSGRMFAALRSGDNSLVYDVASTGLVGTLPGYFAIVAACEPAAVVAVHATIRREIDAIARGDFDEAELVRARSMVTTGELDHLQTPGDFARRAAADELVGLGGEDWKVFLDDVRSVTRDDIVRFGRRFLSHATVALVTPEDSDASKFGIDDVSIHED